MDISFLRLKNHPFTGNIIQYDDQNIGQNLPQQTIPVHQVNCHNHNHGI